MKLPGKGINMEIEWIRKRVKINSIIYMSKENSGIFDTIP
jgi:hypothetical protein